MPDAITFTAPRGMRDFYPEDMVLRTAIFDAWTRAARTYGFEAYDACVVENLDLLKRKGGEEIVEQIYTFKDKSDRDLALRAEMTPTLARMITGRQNELAFPLKWTTIAQCFRYERMSRGRKREHYQWNLDIVGEPSVLAEAEVIAAAIHALGLMGLGADDVRVHVNSRALLSDLLARLGIPREHHAATFLALDKRGKIDDAEIAALLKTEGLDEAHIAAAFRLMGIATFEEAAAALGEPTPALAHLGSFFETLDGYGIRDRVKFDISVIRGLGYYTGIVFEGFDTGRSLRAIFGGGRYDNLLADIGGKPCTAVGLGFGDVVIGELLADKGKVPAAGAHRDLAVAYMDDAQRAMAITVARTLRSAGGAVDLGLHAEKPKHFFARAGKGGFKRAIYLGPDDLTRGTVRVKTLADRTEIEIPLAELAVRLGPAPLP
jgi:histidyl-tRNA synthetase